MRDTARNLSHILISRKDDDLIPAFTIGETTYLIYPRVPASAIVRLTTSENTIDGMHQYVLDCLAKPEHKESFRALLSEIDVDGLGLVIEEIVSKTTPFDSQKPNESSSL
jgi:hypothetical protein